MSFWKRQNYREQNISGCPGFRYSLRGLNRWFSLGGEMIVCYFNESYMTLWICENPYNFTAQEENLVWKFKKTHTDYLGSQWSQDEMENDEII